MSIAGPPILKLPKSVCEPVDFVDGNRQLEQREVFAPCRLFKDIFSRFIY